MHLMLVGNYIILAFQKKKKAEFQIDRNAILTLTEILETTSEDKKGINHVFIFLAKKETVVSF